MLGPCLSCPRCEQIVRKRPVVSWLPASEIQRFCLCSDFEDEQRSFAIRDGQGCICLWARHGFIDATRGVIDLAAGAFSNLRDIPSAIRQLRIESKKRGAWRLQVDVADGNEIAGILRQSGFMEEGRKKDSFRIGSAFRDAILLGDSLVAPAACETAEPDCQISTTLTGPIEIVHAHPNDAAAYMQFDAAVRLETPYLMRTVSEMPSTVAEHAMRLRTIADSTCVCLLARDEKRRIAGAITGTRPYGPCAENDVALWIAVRQECWSCGIGQRLLDTLAAWARQTGARRLTAEVVSMNQRAQAFYAHCGFVVEAHRRAAAILNGAYLDEVVFGRLL